MPRKIPDNILRIATHLIASGTFSVQEFRARAGNPSTKTIYRLIRKWQAEMGMVGAPNARRVIRDYIIHQTWQKLLNILLEEEEKFQPSARKVFDGFIKRITYFFCEDHDLITVLTRGTTSWAQRSPRSFSAYQRVFWDRLRNLVRRAQEEGSLTRDIDPDLLLRLVHGALHETLYGLAIRESVNEQYTMGGAIKAMTLLLDSLNYSSPREPVDKHVDVPAQVKVKFTDFPTMDLGIGFQHPKRK